MEHEGTAKPASVLTTGKVHGDQSLMTLADAFGKIRGTTNASFAQTVSEYARVASGPGAISPRDFLTLRLFDKSFVGASDVREFVGDKRFVDICLAVNYRHDWIAVLSNKVASTAYLEAYGIPTIPIKAVYAPGVSSGGANVIPDKDSLEKFLLRKELYPLFGKPVDSQNSLGSVALRECSSSGEVTTGNGTRVTARQLADEIDATYSSGYLFQNLLRPHPAIEQLCGKRIASVRLLTILTQNGPRICRACWKIPASANMADNYWREGNLLAQLDMQNGKILRVTSGAGLEMLEHTVHPDTSAQLIGAVHPEWEAMKALALSGAALMRHVPLIGWDIACTVDGPTVVEMNEYPDAFIMQFAGRRGILDTEFKAFIEFQKKNAAAFNAQMKARMAL